MPDARQTATVVFALMAVCLLFAGSAASARPVVPAAIHVEEAPRLEEGRVLVRFAAATDRPVALNVQMGLAPAGTCMFQQLDDGQRLIIRAPRDPDARPAEHAGCRAKSAGAQWGPVVRHELQPGSHPLQAEFRSAEHPRQAESPPREHPRQALRDLPAPDTRVFLLVWQDGAKEALLLQAGASFEPDEHAGTMVLANMSVLALALPAQPKERAKDWTLPPFVWLFSRLKRSRVLDHRSRRAIVDQVENEPGIRLFELQAATRLPSGVLTHHLRVLEEHGLVVTVHRGNQRHLYRVAARCTARRDLTERQEEILHLLAQRAFTQTELAQRLGITQQAVNYQIQQLRRRGLLGENAAQARGPRPQIAFQSP